MAFSLKNAALSGLLLFGAGLTSLFAQNKGEMTLSNQLRGPTRATVTITPPEVPSTAPGRITVIDYFAESATEPGVIQTLHLEAVDGHDGNSPDSMIALYDVTSFKFNATSAQGTQEITGKPSTTEPGFDVTSSYRAIGSDPVTETFHALSLNGVDSIQRFMGPRDSRKPK